MAQLRCNCGENFAEQWPRVNIIHFPTCGCGHVSCGNSCLEDHARDFHGVDEYDEVLYPNGTRFEADAEGSDFAESDDEEDDVGVVRVENEDDP